MKYLEGDIISEVILTDRILQRVSLGGESWVIISKRKENDIELMKISSLHQPPPKHTLIPRGS